MCVKKGKDIWPAHVPLLLVTVDNREGKIEIERRVTLSLLVLYVSNLCSQRYFFDVCITFTCCVCVNQDKYCYVVLIEAKASCLRARSTVQKKVIFVGIPYASIFEFDCFWSIGSFLRPLRDYLKYQ